MYMIVKIFIYKNRNSMQSIIAMRYSEFSSDNFPDIAPYVPGKIKRQLTSFLRFYLPLKIYSIQNTVEIVRCRS